MANAIFTFSESSAYDDRPEIRYHFPKTYRRQVEQAQGAWIVYYEPRRTTGPSSATGRMAYFAMAFVDRVEQDQQLRDHYYAYIRPSSYLEFDDPVPFREGAQYFESALFKPDGSTNKGAFGRAVRVIGREEFELILSAGFTRKRDVWEGMDAKVAEPAAEYVVRPRIEQILSKPFRDAAFRRHVRRAYSNTCAITGLRLINGGGRPEVQAAHIRPVEHDGPDSVRNGIALTGTVHWLFDRGLMSLDDSFNVLLSSRGIPEDIVRLIPADRKLLLPVSEQERPHPAYLAWHRENVFKG